MQEERESQGLSLPGILVAISPHQRAARPVRWLGQTTRFRGIVRGQPSMQRSLGGSLHRDVIRRSGKGRKPPAPPAVRCLPNYSYYPGIPVPFLSILYKGRSETSKPLVLDTQRCALPGLQTMSANANTLACNLGCEQTRAQRYNRGLGGGTRPLQDTVGEFVSLRLPAVNE